MTDASNYEAYIALAASVVTLVGLFLGTVQGDKEGAKAKNGQITSEVIGASFAGSQNYRDLSKYLEEIVERLDRLIHVTENKEGEELRKDISDEFRNQSMDLMRKIEEKLGEVKHSGT